MFGWHRAANLKTGQFRTNDFKHTAGRIPQQPLFWKCNKICKTLAFTWCSFPPFYFFFVLLCKCENVFYYFPLLMCDLSYFLFSSHSFVPCFAWCFSFALLFLLRFTSFLHCLFVCVCFFLFEMLQYCVWVWVLCVCFLIGSKKTKSFCSVTKMF